MNEEEFEKFGQIKFDEFEKRRLRLANSKVSKKLNGEMTFMAYLDLDGFKEKLYQNSDKLFHDFRRLIMRITHSYVLGVIQHSIGDQQTQVNHFDKILAPRIFSDSIFIPTIDDSEEAFAQLSTISSIIMVKSILIGLTCRGAISVGNTYLDPEFNIVIGKSVAKSAQLASQLQTFGVAIDPDIQANPEHATQPVNVNVKIGNDLTKMKLQFSKVNACIPHQEFDINRIFPVEKYLIIQKEYKERKDAREKIIQRYESGLQILKLVLEN